VAQASVKCAGQCLADLGHGLESLCHLRESTVEILPAIDLRAGKVIRLAQGDYQRQTTYSDHPGDVAEEFAKAGCRWLHVVDLDAARSGRPVNLSVVGEIARRADLKIELGGGIRSDAAVQAALDAGASRVIIGSAAVNNWPLFEGLLHRPELAGKVALSLDARAGRLAVYGWTQESSGSAVEFARQVKGLGVAAIIYTDIHRDGMMTGPNFQMTAELIGATDVPVIASGGVSGIEDVLRCRQIGCAGVIIGRAYYEGRLDLKEALRVAQDET
jgi:phosphoribosylformimino-5-aminoimidazole carboxamide ribotide isomerase